MKAAFVIVAILLGLAGLGLSSAVPVLRLASLAREAAATDQPVAATGGGPSVAVTLAPLRKGSLPRTVTAYGKVETSPSARQTVMAPVAAVVDRVYVKTGEQVVAGAPLARLGPSPATSAAYTQAVVALRAATGQASRTRTLLSQHLATKQQLADAEKAASDAKAALAALKTEGAGSPRTLRAPFAAIVTAVSTTPGAIVAQGAPLLDLARPTGLILRAGVVPAQAVGVNTGDAVTVTPLGGTRGEAARVLLRGSVVDQQTGLISVDIAVPEAVFFAGQMAQADIVIGKAAGYVVPHRAILVGNSGGFYVVQAVNGVAREVDVRVLLDAGERDVIEGALVPAAPLVLAGNYQLKSGMKLRVAGSAAKGGS